MMDRSAGVDWASERHAICVLESDGRVVERSVSEHDANGLRTLCARLVELGVERVAIERPDGVLVEQLLEAELVVLAIHPNQVKAARPRPRSPSAESAAPIWARASGVAKSASLLSAR